MTPEWIYLLKANVGIALFYAFYKLFCQRDTFFQWRRIALLSFLGMSFVYPLLNIQHWVKEQPSMYELASYYATFMDESENVSAPVTATSEIPGILTICYYLYLIGVVVLSIRFLVQLLSILRMRWIGKATTLNGQRIISLPCYVSPFSFFQWIFIHLPMLDKESQHEILMHEQTHAKQWHSVDVIISEIINIVCWFNPFMWLLKSEIRLNLEYLADNKVVETSIDHKQYQYHLLGLTHISKQTGLYNNFNVSHLKRRIIMMNKKRTRTAGRIKYALFAPLAAALLLVSNIEAVARTVEKVMDASEATNTVPQDKPKEDQIFQICEVPPQFPGGVVEWMKFLSANMKYPAEAKEKKQEGRVIVQFIVEKDGSITNAKVVRGVSPLLDQEALRVVGIMPKWNPATQRGQAVRVQYTLPVMFSLNGKIDEMQQHQVNMKPNEKGIYNMVEEPASFPGGMANCLKFLSENVKYPEDCKKEGIQGRVIAQFIIDKDGSVIDVKIVRGVHPSLDKEAIRMIESMPKWTPGKVKGEPVKCQYTLPIAFKI